MKKTRKKYLMILFLTLSITLLPMGGVKAALQANPNTHVKKTASATNWITSIRKMEETNGTMGLSESLNLDLTSKESNNIDVHMMRTTEYGAIAILSTSGYGNPKTLQNSSIKTTTGNKTGVYFTGDNWELNAGGFKSGFEGVNAKYYDTYTSSSSTVRVGDAFECNKWHLASENGWVDAVYPGYTYLSRDKGGLFSFKGSTKNESNFGRGVAVCGTGL